MTADLPELPEIPEEVYITDPSQFEALTSVLRMRILKLCREPLPVRGIAERLEMPVTSLYYHINMLEDAGFIEIVHTRKSGARLEKIYRVTGRSITPGPELLANIEDPAAAAKALTAVVLEPARAETEDALRRRFSGEERKMSLGRSAVNLTPSQFETVTAQLNELIESLTRNRNQDPDDGNAGAYAFTFTLIPFDD